MAGTEWKKRVETEAGTAEIKREEGQLPPRLEMGLNGRSLDWGWGQTKDTKRGGRFPRDHHTEEKLRPENGDRS